MVHVDHNIAHKQHHEHLVEFSLRELLEKKLINLGCHLSGGDFWFVFVLLLDENRSVVIVFFRISPLDV